MAIIRVLPDIPAVDRPFDYTADGEVPVGTVVRVPFGGRRVRGWVLDDDVVPPAAVELRSVSKIVGHGPDGAMIDLCRWAAWRWSGRLVTMMRLATPDKVVRSIPPLRAPLATGVRSSRSAADIEISALQELSDSMVRSEPGSVVFRTSPTSDHVEIALAAADSGQAIVVTPSPVEVDRLVRLLRSRGHRVARWPWDWAEAAAGATVVGTRGAVFAPAPMLSSIVVLDEHDALLQSESSPTWNAREVAVERARRNDVPCLLVSPCPSLEAYRAQAGVDILDGSKDSGGAGSHRSDSDSLITPGVSLSASANRDGYAVTVVIDRRGEDTRRSGLFSSELVKLMRRAIEDGRPITCILNRTGRARLLACRSCSTIATCHECGSSMYQPEVGVLECGRCGATRPALCADCGSMALAQLRLGVSRASEELEALLRVPVSVVTASDRPEGDVTTNAATMGTVAALDGRTPGGLVAFLDFDQELLAPRYRAAEDALSLLIEGYRKVGGRSGGGRIVIQTRIPDHEVIVSAVRADPSVLSETEFQRRRMLGLPPAASVARIGGEAASEYIDRLDAPEGVDVTAAEDGNWLVRSRTPCLLQDTLAKVERPTGRLRLHVDPHRLTR